MLDFINKDFKIISFQEFIFLYKPIKTMDLPGEDIDVYMTNNIKSADPQNVWSVIGHGNTKYITNYHQSSNSPIYYVITENKSPNDAIIEIDLI